MKKLLLILVIAISFGMSANAQDIILKQDGSEIKVKVLEITDQQVKYKDFDFQSGPIRNINISEVFMITYENGQKELFNKPNATNATATQQQTSSSQRQSVTNCVKKTAFGLDLGIGGSFFTMYNNDKAPSMFASTVGIRVMHHFNPYFGIDFLKMNGITDVLKDEWLIRLQIMSGIRGNTPVFFQCMSVYSAFRLGYGMTFGLLSHYEGLSLETELGLNLTSTVFAGFAYNCHKYFVKGSDSKLAMHTLSFRLGFNFGKTTVESKNNRNTKSYETFTQQPKPQSYPQIQQTQQVPLTPLTPLQIEFNRIGTDDKAMLEFFRKNAYTAYYYRFYDACKQKNKATGWLVSGSIFTAGGMAFLIGREIVLNNAHPYEVLINHNYRGLTVTGSILIGIGQVFTITSIPIYVKAASKKKEIKNDFVIEHFSGKYSYHPELNIGITQSGNMGLTLNF